jgi:xylan 1,4-beta-xylosidase
MDEVGLYNEDAQGRPVYNFSYVDQIYDGLLENGVRPFVEISFMPEKLASTSSRQAFWYEPYNSPPRDWGRWSDLIENFARHLVARYGIDQVSSWYFEVWNEPNIDFWAGEPKQATYFRLYDVTARALKQVSSRLRVGGPATAQAAWVDAFIRHAVEDRVPLDFVSTHVYANDTAQDVFGTHEIIPRDQMVYRAVKMVHDEVKASSRPDLPIIFSEYNASYMNEVDVTDSEFLGAWLANTIRQCDGLVDSLAYWSFSDVFEEQGVVKRPFYGGFGLMAVGHIPKASYNAFRLLHRLGTERLEVDSDSVLATRRADGSLAIAVWNYAPPGDTGSVQELTLILAGLEGPQVVWISRVDHDHGSALAAWEAMGSPNFPTRDEQDLLRAAGKLSPPEFRRLVVTNPAKIAVTVPPHGLMLLDIQRSIK